MNRLKTILLLSCLTIFCGGSALADTCDAFASFTCSKSTPNVVNLNGTGSTGQSVGILLGNSTFTLNINGNKSVIGDDLVLVAAFPNGMAGKADGVAFTSVLSFPEGAANGAIQSTWSGLGISAKNVQYGYANLGVIGSGPLSVTENGIPKGTILYGEIVNPTTGKILYITPNSEAGLMNVATTATPEPGTLSMFATGILGLVGLVRRKFTQA